MFTGLIEDVGWLRQRRLSGASGVLTVETHLPAADIDLGASVAVNGVCLTKVSASATQLTFDVSRTTLDTTTLGALPLGARVNLEQALRVGDRMGGHMVQGHVDGVGRFVERRQVGASWEYTFTVPTARLAEVVEKGSIAIDGISLTVARLAHANVTVAVVPHTHKATHLHALPSAAPVNVETDIIGKYVRRALGLQGESSGLTLDKLKAHGLA